VTSTRQRTWWRNLLGGAPLIVRMCGVDYPATGHALESDAEVAGGLESFFKVAPQTARYYQIKLDASGNPSQQDIARAAQSRVVIRIDL
jgi:hypothetical protein